MQPPPLWQQKLGLGMAALLCVTMMIVSALGSTRPVVSSPLDTGQVSLNVAYHEPMVVAAAVPRGDDDSPNHSNVPAIDQPTVDERSVSHPQAEPAQPTTWTYVDDLNTACDE